MSLQTGADLIEDALRKSGEKTDGTSDFADSALKYMNAFYRSIISGGNEFDVDLAEPWVWAKAQYPGVLTILQPYTTGTVTTTKDSVNGSFSIAPSTSQANTYLMFTANNSASGTFETYRILSHTAGATAFALDGPFNDATQTTATFQCNRIDYQLNAASICRQIGPMKIYRAQTSDADYEGKVVGLDIRSFEKKYPLFRIQAGPPTEFAILSNANGVVTVRFNKYLDPGVLVNTRVEYDYIPFPTDLTNDSSSIPVIPDGFRQCLSYATAFAVLTDKEDSKAKDYFALAKAKLMAMKNANRKEFMQISKNRGRLVPRGDDFGVRNWPTSGQ